MNQSPLDFARPLMDATVQTSNPVLDARTRSFVCWDLNNRIFGVLVAPVLEALEEKIGFTVGGP